MYEALQVPKCGKCGKIVAQPKELVRIVKRAWAIELLASMFCGKL